MPVNDEQISPYSLKAASAEEMRRFDTRAVEEFGVPSIDLMEKAGRHVFQAVRDTICGISEKRILVICGKGNNGGDGFVAARHLIDTGAFVSVLLLGNPSEVTGDARTNLDILINSGLNPEVPEIAYEIKEALGQSDIVIDAIFGTGLRGEVKGLPADAIHAVNESGLPVYAVDIPSGLDADTGRTWGACVKAEYTITFALPKIGLLMFPGMSYTGKLIVGDIGIPQQLYDEVKAGVTSSEWAASRLPKRSPDAHKGTFGSIVLIAGSKGLTGAAAMAAESSLRAGAGLSTLAVPSSLQDILAVKLTEVMTYGLPETEARSFSADAAAAAEELINKATAVVLGCGIAAHPETCKFVEYLLASASKPMVLDADGLNCIAQNITLLEGKHGALVITPHPGEMARLLGTTSESIQSNRIDAVREASARFRCITVLKGARTLISDPSGQVFINPTGNVGLASAGSGDVLAGTVGGLLAQGMSPLDAAVCGAYIHGRAGDIAESELGTAGMIAGDVMRALPLALKELYEGC